MRFLLLLCLVAPAFCGQRIVGGSPVDIADHPHMLSMRESGSHICGASLISNTRAVTAAHCCGSPIGVYTLLGGTSDYTVTNCATCQLFGLTNIDIHPNYDENGNGFPNDVAVLSFGFVAFNANFQAISMAQSGSFAGDRCFITGWGQPSGGGIPPRQLQGAAMTVMTNAECAGVWGAASINDGHVCITDPDSSSCNGDSGGPLVCSNLLVGIESWEIANCSPAWPSVYTRISYFYGWIIIQ